MLLFAAAFATASPCSSIEIARAASVSPEHQESEVALRLSNIASGFQKPAVQQIAWLEPCAPTVIGLYGGNTLVTADGAMFSTRGKAALQVRDDRMLAPDSEPPHPAWDDHRLTASSSLLAGGWRVGSWVRPDGKTDIARYRPGESTTPITLMTSGWPLVGIFYLALPDAPGGTLFFAQRLGPSKFTMVSVGWSEAGLRTPNH